MKFKSLRLDSKLSQQALATLMKVDQTAISQWETGRTLPRADRLPELAKIFDCSVDELFSTDEPKAV